MTEKITDTTNEVELTKYSDEEGYYLPAIVYEFTSDRSETALVRVVESLPDEIDSADFGFHERFGRDDWEWEDDQLVLETEIDGGAEYKAVFAMRDAAPYEVTELVTPPDEFTVEPAVPTVATSNGTGTFTRSSSSNHSGNAESAEDSETTRIEQGVDEDRQVSTNGETSILDDGDGLLSSESTDGESDPEDVEDAEDAEDATDAEDVEDAEDSADTESSVIDQLIAELEADAVADERLEQLQQRLLPEADSTQSVDVRVRQLQNDLADFRAYTNAMEQFIDEHGSAEEVVSQFESRLDSFETTLNSVESSVADNETDISGIREETTEIQSDLESLSDELSSATDDISELSADIASVNEQVPEFEIEDRFEAVEADLAEVSGYVENLKQVFQDH